MARTAYPTGSDLSAYLLSLGTLTSTTGLGDLNLEMQAQAEEWERLTGWRPFAPEAQASDSFYDPPSESEYLVLGACFVRVTEVADGADSYADPVVAGNLLTLGTDYLLEPYNGATEGPITCVRFLRGVFGGRRSVRVKGIKGWAAEIPADVWQALLQGAASACYPQLSALVSGGVLRLKTQSTEVTFSAGQGQGPLSSEKAAWDRKWRDTVRRYRRLTL